jgi:hypothetical protein
LFGGFVGGLGGIGTRSEGKGYEAAVPFVELRPQRVCLRVRGIVVQIDGQAPPNEKPLS